MRHGGLAAGCRIVHAQRLVAFIDAVKAIGGADAGADILFAAVRDLGDDMRIGDQRPGHAHHVEFALGDGMAGGRHIVDAGGVEHREFRQCTDFTGEIEMRRGFHAGDRDDIGQRRIVLDVALDDVEEVDQAAIAEALADLEALIAGDALFPIFIGGDAQAHGERVANAAADRLQHTQAEAQAVVERAAIDVLAAAGGGRPETVHQMAVALQLEAIEAGFLHALGGIGIIADDAFDVPVFHFLREGAVGGLADGRGGDDGQPVGRVPYRAAAQMRQLDHHRRAMRVALVCELPQPRHDLVLVGQKITKNRCRIA